MSDFFKESDCDEWRSLMNIEKSNRGYGSSAAMEQYGFIRIDKANRLLKERGTVVYLRQENLNNGATYIWNRTTTKSPEMEVTHRALLINIEPIEKDSAEKIVEDWLALQSKPQREYVREESQLLDRAKALREGK